MELAQTETIMMSYRQEQQIRNSYLRKAICALLAGFATILDNIIWSQDVAVEGKTPTRLYTYLVHACHIAT